MSRTRIKVCGVTDLETAWVVAEAGADAIGFVFVRSSPRFIDPKDAASIVLGLPPMVASVGLLVNPSPDTFDDVMETCPTTYTQLQGNEPVDMVRDVGPNIIKGFRFDPATIDEDLVRWSKVEEVDAILVDGSTGGHGESFDWSGLAAVRESCTKPLILAGGLTPENVEAAIRATRPWAVDVSSGVESERGVKDHGLIRAFCDAVRDADHRVASEAS